MDHKILKKISKLAPLSYRAFFGRKYLLPTYRQADYSSQEFENYLGFDRLCAFSAGAFDPNDEVWRISLGSAGDK